MFNFNNFLLELKNWKKNSSIGSRNREDGIMKTFKKEVAEHLRVDEDAVDLNTLSVGQVLAFADAVDPEKESAEEVFSKRLAKYLQVEKITLDLMTLTQLKRAIAAVEESNV